MNDMIGDMIKLISEAEIKVTGLGTIFILIGTVSCGIGYLYSFFKWLVSLWN